jgi:hydroxyacylglutathione hydrolase
VESFDVEWIHGFPDCTKNKDPPIQVYQNDENTFIMRQNKCIEPEVSFEAPFMYLLFGDRRVMLLDTGASRSPMIFPIGSTVAEIISKWLAAHNLDSIPLVVCHSHSHGDHTQGDDQFINFNDVTIVPPSLLEVKKFFKFNNWPEQIVSVDLGNRKIDVIPIPGHEKSHISLYDENTKILFTGDTLYPGLLVINDWKAYRDSISRLKIFTDDNQPSFILGAHIEMKNTPGKWFGYPCLFQPNEHVLQLEMQHLSELHDAIVNLEIPNVDRHNDFIIQPANLPSPPPDN